MPIKYFDKYSSVVLASIRYYFDVLDNKKDGITDFDAMFSQDNQTTMNTWMLHDNYYVNSDEALRAKISASFIDYKKYSLDVMNITKANLSPRSREFISLLVASAAMKVYKNSTQDGRDWIVLVGIESKFNTQGVSSTGAIGLGQLIPRYYKDFGKSCDYTDLSQSDIYD